MAVLFWHNLGHGEGISIAHITAWSSTHHCMVLTLPVGVKVHLSTAQWYVITNRRTPIKRLEQISYLTEGVQASYKML